MEIFAWNPDAGAETLDAFNQRLEDFCIANPVLQIVPSIIGGSIALSLTEAADADVNTLNCLVPVVIFVPEAQMLALEAHLGQCLQALKARDSEDEPFTPFQVTLHPATGGAYAVVLVSAGELDLDGDAGPGDASDPDAGAIP